MLRPGDDGERRAGEARRILWAQGVRALAYGLAALLLGTTLDRLGLTGLQAGAVLAAVAASSVRSNVAVARAGDWIGRRRMYLILCLLLGASGAIFAYATSGWLFTVAALTGTVSTEVIASGLFASLDRAMLTGEPDGARLWGPGPHPGPRPQLREQPRRVAQPGLHRQCGGDASCLGNARPWRQVQSLSDGLRILIGARTGR
ncbi:MAG: hypothetical protein ACYDEA_03520 [Candidatus Dormibacteria bacterium]